MFVAKLPVDSTLTSKNLIDGGTNFDENTLKLLSQYEFGEYAHACADIILDNNWDTSVNNECSTCLIIGAVNVNPSNRSVYFVGKHPRGYWMASRINVLKADESEFNRSRCSTVLSTNKLSGHPGSLTIDGAVLDEIYKLLNNTTRI